MPAPIFPVNLAVITYFVDALNSVNLRAKRYIDNGKLVNVRQSLEYQRKVICNFLGKRLKAILSLTIRRDYSQAL